MFLTEKLPRVEEEGSDGQEDGLTMARRRVARAIRIQLEGDRKASTECEPFCGCLACFPAEQVVLWKVGNSVMRYYVKWCLVYHFFLQGCWVAHGPRDTKGLSTIIGNRKQCTFEDKIIDHKKCSHVPRVSG